MFLLIIINNNALKDLRRFNIQDTYIDRNELLGFRFCEKQKYRTDNKLNIYLQIHILLYV